MQHTMFYPVMSRPCLLVLSLLLWLATPALAAPPEGYRFLPLGDAARQASNEGKPMFLYFGRYGCSTCRKMEAEVFSDAALAERLNAGFVLAYVDTESGERIRLGSGEVISEMQYAARNRILGTPTFVFISPEQKPLFKKAGFQSIAQMHQYADYILDDHFRSMPLAEFVTAQ